MGLGQPLDLGRRKWDVGAKRNNEGDCLCAKRRLLSDIALCLQPGPLVQKTLSPQRIPLYDTGYHSDRFLRGEDMGSKLHYTLRFEASTISFILFNSELNLSFPFLLLSTSRTAFVTAWIVMPKADPMSAFLLPLRTFDQYTAIFLCPSVRLLRFNRSSSVNPS